MLPAATEAGAAELATIRSACPAPATMSAALAVLFEEFGSVVDELTVTVSVIRVPAAVPTFTCTTREKLAVPGARLGLVQTMIPDPPIAG